MAPSVSTTIEFNVSYNKNLVRHEHPVMAIDTEYPKRNIEEQCSFIRYRQLRNENLYTYLRVGRYKGTTCTLSGNYTVTCRGTVNIQDYIPRKFYLSFGFHCNTLRINSLQGLKYNISFTKQSNKTNGCIKYSIFDSKGTCSRFYNETSVPNLFGDEHVYQIMGYLKHSMTFEALIFVDGTCYQHFWEVMCHILLPKCDPANNK